MALISKMWMAAVLATMSVYYAAEVVTIIKEAVSAKHQDGSDDTKLK